MKEELETTAAHATSIALEKWTFSDRAREVAAACSEEPISLESIKFDILNIVWRNDTRGAPLQEVEMTFGVELRYSVVFYSVLFGSLLFSV